MYNEDYKDDHESITEMELIAFRESTIKIAEKTSVNVEEELKKVLFCLKTGDQVSAFNHYQRAQVFLKLAKQVLIVSLVAHDEYDEVEEDDIDDVDFYPPLDDISEAQMN